MATKKKLLLLYKKRMPLGSVLALVISFLGTIVFCTQTYRGAVEIQKLSDDVFAFLIPWIERVKTAIIFIGVSMLVVTVAMAVVGFSATRHYRACYKNNSCTTTIGQIYDKNGSTTIANGDLPRNMNNNNKYKCKGQVVITKTVIDSSGNVTTKTKTKTPFLSRLRNNEKIHTIIGGSTACSVFWILSYVLNFFWLMLLSITVVLTSAYFAFLPVCLPQAGLEQDFCFNFTLFSLMISGGKDPNAVNLILCGGAVDKFCKLSKGVMPWFWGSFAGCLIVLMGLSHHNASLSAGFTHCQHAKRYKKLHAKYTNSSNNSGNKPNSVPDGKSASAKNTTAIMNGAAARNGVSPVTRNSNGVSTNDVAHGTFKKNGYIIGSNSKDGCSSSSSSAASSSCTTMVIDDCGIHSVSDILKRQKTNGL